MCDQTGPAQDVDPLETAEWQDAIEDVIGRWGPERARWLLERAAERAGLRGVRSPFAATTPAVNTIPADAQPEYPGDLELERRIEGYLRWNAVAIVQRANEQHPGLGGHLSTYASMATVYEVAYNHFFHGRTKDHPGDQIYFQGHGAPGLYARAFLEGRLDERALEHFREELAPGGGLSSYPHPWLMPDFWQFPTVSMGLAAISSIYQARFNRYLAGRGLVETKKSRVWCFCGDGEMDEPESLGALTVATRERLDNLTFVINCNLQRLDGPVRGNGSIVAELEGIFRGAGWNVVKVLWSSEWDALFAKDEGGHLARRLAETVDGQLQKLASEPPSVFREHLFSGSPELEALGQGVTDEQVARLRRGGHDPVKVYAGLKAAVEHQGGPSVVLVHTVKGFGLASAEGRNSAHQQKSLKAEDLATFFDRFGLNAPRADELGHWYLHPGPDSAEVKYLKDRRHQLGGPIPRRVVESPALPAPSLESLAPFLEDSKAREASTTMAFVRLLSQLLKDKALGKLVVPIVPDESRTFGMEALFGQIGIYSAVGQLYEPIDKKSVTPYREAKNGQYLQEGISEAAGLCSWIAAGTAYATHATPTIPFFVFYSMFGFQRVMDLIWSGADARARGFLMGATAGRTTLNGEGLQHEDGHSLLLASAVPHCKAYDPAFGYETAVIVRDGLRRMYEAGEPGFYYITLYNENYAMPAMPEGAHDGIVAGLYLVKAAQGGDAKTRPQLFGSGSILRQVLQAQELLAARGVHADVWSVTSYSELARDANACERWNRLHPGAPPKAPYVAKALAGRRGPFVASSDWVRLVAEQVRPWIPGSYTVLGTDGFGRSDTRAALRRHFEVDAEHVVVATLSALAAEGRMKPADVAAAIKELGVKPDAPDPATA